MTADDLLVWRAALLGVALAAAGCPPSSSRAPAICTPGGLFDCECADRSSGVQVCNESGTAWGPCECGGDGDADADGDTDGDGDGDADSDADADGDADPVDALDRWRDAENAKAHDCCVDVEEATTLFHDTYQDLYALIDDGVEVSASLVDRCIGEIERASCSEWQYWLGAMPGPCRTFYSGTRSAGDACETAYECEPDMSCSFQDQAYTCQPAPDLGDACISGCRRGLVCRFTDSTCAQPLTLGDECGDDSECGSNLCRNDPPTCVAWFCAGNVFN